MLTPEQINEYRTKYGFDSGNDITSMPSTNERVTDIESRMSLLPESPKPLTIGERFKLSFGGPEKIAELKQREAEAGLRGKFDVGDIADVAGSMFPIIGGILGGAGGTVLGTPVGGVAGAAIGATAGESVKQAVGRLLGVREDQSLGKEFVDLGTTLATTYIGGKVLDKAFTFAFKRIPERFYSGLFKNVADDISDLTKSEYIAQLQKTNPKLFEEYVKNGVINVKNGIVEVNKTLAREVLEEGLRGNPRTMMTIAYGRMLDLENQVRNQVVNKTIKVANKEGYEELLNTFITHFKANNYGFNPERLANAEKLLQSLKSAEGNEISAETALWLRRFIDGMRNTKSFLADVNLAPKQEAFRTAASNLRGLLAKEAGLGDIMGKYRVYIEAFESLADYAAKSENRALLNLTDAIVGGGGLASGFPGTGLGLMFALRLFQQPLARTSIAQGLYGIGKGIEKTIPTGLTASTIGQEVGKIVPQFISDQKEK